MQSSIEFAIKMSEQVSNVMKSVTGSLNMTIEAMSDVNRSSKDMFDTTSLDAARESIKDTELMIKDIEDEIKRNADEQENFNEKIREGEKATNGLLSMAKKVGMTIAGYIGANKLMDLSDEMAQNTARLEMMNDGLQTTEQLNNMIYQSAQRSRGVYLDNVDSVAKMGILAKDAFSSNLETIGFVEQLNKMYAISGTSLQGIQAANLQIQQAMGMGVLRGQELNSVFEQVPLAIEAIAKYLDTPIGKIRDMAADGEITAQVFKAAMLQASEETNRQFEEMPKTFAQVANDIKNQAVMMIDPFLDRLNEIANSSFMEGVVNSVIGGVSIIVSGLSSLLDTVEVVGGFIADHWSIILPLILSAVSVYGVLNAAIITNIGVQALASIQNSLTAVSLYLQSAATFVLTLATQGLNAALAASPITWVIAGIMLMIGAFYAAVAVVNHFKGTTVSATGIIVGAISVAASIIINIFIALGNLVITVVVSMHNITATFAEFIANVFIDPINSVKILFMDLGTFVLDIMLGIAGVIDTVFGSNLSAAVSGWKSTLKSAIKDIRTDEMIEIPKIELEDKLIDRINYGDSWNSGYDLGKGLAGKAKGLFKAPELDLQSDAIDYAKLLEGIDGTLGDIDKDQKKGNKKLKGANDKLDITNEDIKLLRDVAEQRVINRFTNRTIAPISVEFTGPIDNEFDVDLVIGKVKDKLNQEISAGMEGVHE